MGHHILIVEDDLSIASFLKRALAFEGYTVAATDSGETGLHAALRSPVDLIILDLMLPGIDGLEVCGRLRSAGEKIPILILTAKESVPDRVAGLKAGADDYLVKPFALEELLARVEALLRRATAPVAAPLHFVDLVLDPVAHTVRRHQRVILLTAKEFEILEFFLRHARQVLTRDQLYESIWGYDFGADSNVIEVFVRNIRTKLEAEGEPRLIHTIRGVGYVLREPEL
ncbi:MAG: response regulator transcription factor [Ardenticatenaceae bacterium]|nr:response regulator transcription factor [Ardenticatenaceae bacterium]